MRVDRIPEMDSHTLVLAKPGLNRFKPGKYECSCGIVLTGINKFETHIADMRAVARIEKMRSD